MTQLKAKQDVTISTKTFRYQLKKDEVRDYPPEHINVLLDTGKFEKVEIKSKTKKEK